MMKKDVAKKIVIFLGVFIIGLFGYSLKDGPQETEDPALQVDPDNELLQYFIETHPDNEIILAGLEDVNSDGRKDLVVIYNESYRKNAMVVVLNMEKGIKLTEHVSAPVENNTLKFDDIDDEDPIEIIITGSKDGNYGYGLFRVIDDHELKDIFGTGMENCW